jgi:chromate reductase
MKPHQGAIDMEYRIAVLVGSLRHASFNMQLARALEKLMPPHMKLTFADLDVPLYNQDLDNAMPTPAVALKTLIRESEGVLFVTPEHNRSIPAALKNAIDWGSRPPGQNVWQGKPCGIVGISPSAAGTALAQQHLRNILAAEGSPALTTPEVFLQMKDGFFGPDHSIANTATRAFLQGWVDRYVAWIEKLAQ